MGTPEFAVPTLARLIKDSHDVACVFTQPDKPVGRGGQMQSPPVKLLAMQHSIAVHQPAKIKTNEDVRRVFELVAPDACVVTAYGKILPAWLLAIPRLGCINVHASLLPKYRGAAPINWAIANGELETGITTMQMDPGMDTGPMLMKSATAIGPAETAPELSARLAETGAALLSQTLVAIESGTITPVTQDDGEASYAPMLKREDGLIDWSMTAVKIANRVRGFQPWPGSYTAFRGHRLILWRAHPAPAPGPATAASSSVTQIGESHVRVVCGDRTSLDILELQIEGKRRLSARDFANGFRLKTGDKLADTPEHE
ncbi:MAG TPA: methionyl-tRNA formyltransferase [Blastocatellia bacterium]|nr:methionyl-tRNA formyltransferase [Blastocatellia bacterium]